MEQYQEEAAEQIQEEETAKFFKEIWRQLCVLAGDAYHNRKLRGYFFLAVARADTQNI